MRYILMFQCYREDGSPIYSGYREHDDKYRTFPSREAALRDLEFYFKGHPHVFKVRANIMPVPDGYEEDIPVDRSPEALRDWNKKNQRT